MSDISDDESNSRHPSIATSKSISRHRLQASPSDNDSTPQRAQFDFSSRGEEEEEEEESDFSAGGSEADDDVDDERYSLDEGAPHSIPQVGFPIMVYFIPNPP